MPEFDLTRRPWIPVLDGTDHRHVNITDALTHAHRLHLATTDPTERTVLLRLLAAVLDAATGTGTTARWDEQWNSPALDGAAITAYLEQHRDAFDLFHPERPFGQCGLLAAVNRDTHALRAGSWSGTASTHFDWTQLGPARPLAAADAALALLVLQGVHPGGIQSGHPGDPRTKGGKVYGSHPGLLSCATHVMVEPEGAFLKDLLLMMTPPGPRAEDDRPAWEQPPAPVTGREREPAGRLDLWTWPSRRVRLLPDDDGRVAALALHDGDRTADPGTAVRAADPCAAISPSGARFDLRGRDGRGRDRGFEAPWAAVLALPGTDRTAAAPAIAHLVAACERGTVDPATVLALRFHRVEHTTAHRAAISAVLAPLLPLGPAAHLADPAVRDQLLAAARRAAGLRHRIHKLAEDARLPGGDRVDLAADPGVRTAWNRYLHDLDRPGFDDALHDALHQRIARHLGATPLTQAAAVHQLTTA
ncbi:type I-E CRISPR-associated protein Cse1/CasA [Kitasatospora sp. NPDC092948]|uniref:type I-E CRISPR-associated protein Cse1/CasA n=1 Tax=Kitasatospora sp. NPDC092948 TaxID=3364088 RepID=UPI00381A8C17